MSLRSVLLFLLIAYIFYCYNFIIFISFRTSSNRPLVLFNSVLLLLFQLYTSSFVIRLNFPRVQFYHFKCYLNISYFVLFDFDILWPLFPRSQFSMSILDRFGFGPSFLLFASISYSFYPINCEYFLSFSNHLFFFCY